MLRESGAAVIQPKRYNLLIDPEIFEEVKSIAKQERVQTVELIRQFIRLGLAIKKIQAQEDCKFVLRKGKKEKEIVFL